MAKLNLEVIFGAKDKLSPALKAMVGGSKLATVELKKAKDTINQLNASQLNIDNYKKFRAELDLTNAEIVKHKQVVASLKQAANLGPLGREQTQAINKSQKSLEKLNATYDKQSQKLTQSVQGLHKAGMSVDSLAQDEAKLKDNILQTTLAYEKQKQALERIHVAQKSYQDTQAKLSSVRSVATKGLMVAGAGAAALSIPIRASIDFESSMAEIAKVVDGLKDEFGKTTPAYAAMNNEILTMSTRLPMAARDIATIVAAGGQSGIAVHELTKFAESAVKMGVAFDITADEAGQSMAEMRTAFRMSHDQVVDLADKINYLGNNTPAAAKAIMGIVQRVGPLGEVSGYASGSIAALGATLRGMGVQEEVAATGIQNFMLALVAGESATKKQHNAFVALGMDAKQVSKEMQHDAEATTLKILEAVNRLPKDQQAAMLQNLFGKESIKAIAPLLNNMPALRDNFLKVGDASEYAGSMEKEYAARAATTANNVQLLKNNFAAIGITVGNMLLPSLNNLLTKGREVLDMVQAWVQKNPALAATIAKVAVGAIAVLGGVSALAIGLTAILGPLAFLKMSLLTLSGGVGIFAGLLKALVMPIKLVGMAFMWVGRAMLANPMILAMTAIVTVVAGAAYLIYKNWTPIKAFFGDLWTGVKSSFQSGMNYIKGIIQRVDTVFANNPILHFFMPLIGIPRLIVANWSSITAFFSEVWSVISIGARDVWTSLTALFSPLGQWFGARWSEVKSAASDTWTSVSSSASTAWDVIATVFSPAGSWFSACWGEIKTAFAGGIAGISALILNWSPIGLFYTAFAKVLSWFGVDLPAKFSEFGKNIIDGLIGGIQEKFEKLKSVWATINSYMPDFMRKKMDIHSPSRLFKSLGGYVMQGWQIGIADGIAPLKTVFDRALGVFDAPQLAITSGTAPVMITPPIISKPITANNSNSRVIQMEGDNITIHIHQTASQTNTSIIQEIRAELQRFEREKAARMRTRMMDGE